jgi:PadR family transcriptional regulator PadR
MGGVLNETEQLVLLALARLREDAYGVMVHREIEDRSGRPVSIAAVYAAADRLERRGFVESWLSDPTPERGGRAKKHFRVSAAGIEALEAAREAMDQMWEGLDLRAGGATR